MRPDKEIEEESKIFNKKSAFNINNDTNMYTLHNLFTDINSLKSFEKLDLKLFRKILCDLNIIKMKNFSYHATEESLSNNILENGSIQKNKHGYTYYQILVTDYGREYIIDKLRLTIQ